MNKTWFGMNPHVTDELIGDRIKRYRDEEGMGMHDAKKRVRREMLLEAIDDARFVGHLKPILREIVNGGG